MRNTIAFAVATALIACGGSLAPQNNGPTDKVEVSTDLSTIGVLPAYPTYATLVFAAAPAAYPSVTATNGLTYNVLLAPCSPVNPAQWTTPPAQCWDSFNAKFQNVTLNLAAGTYSVTANFFATDPTAGATAPTALYSATASATVSGTTGTGKLSFVPAFSESPAAAGVYLTSLTSSLGASGFTSMIVGQTNTFTAVAADNSSAGATFGYAYAAAPSGTATCVGTFTGSAFSGIAAGDKCKITLTVTSSSAATAVRTWTITGANSTTVSGGGVTPIITSITLAGTGAGDATCTLTKPVAGWVGANVTCPQAFKLAASPLSPANWFAPQANWGIFTVNYDVGAAGIDGNNPPSVTIRTFCNNDAFVFDPAIASKAYIASATTGSANANGYPTGCLNTAASPCFNVSAANAGDAFWPGFGLNSYYDTKDTTPTSKLQTEPTWWAEPVIANSAFVFDGSGHGPAPLCAVAPRDPVSGAANGACSDVTAPVVTQCSFQVIVTNQGAKDRLTFFANFQ